MASRPLARASAIADGARRSPLFLKVGNTMVRDLLEEQELPTNGGVVTESEPSPAAVIAALRYLPRLKVPATPSPVSVRPLPYSRQDITEDDIAAVVSVLRSDFLTQGQLMLAFSESEEHRLRRRHETAAIQLYLGLLATLLGYIGWNVGLRALGATRAVSYTYAVSPTAVLIAAVTLDEPVTAWLVLGGVLVVLGVVLVQRTGAGERLALVARMAPWRRAASASSRSAS